jgi:hypothetical protein
LRFSKNDNLAIAGAMLLESNPHIQHENGAIFDFRGRPLKHGLNLRSKNSLLKNNILEHIDYGAWWFFAFPLSHVKKYPFPFFVRGDDISFSLANSFDVASLNGIASWQPSFNWKTSPLTIYLDARSNLTQQLLSTRANISILKLCSMITRLFVKNNFSYHYSTAEAVCIAVEDFLGPAKFWHDNVDLQAKREQLKPLIDSEKLVPMQLASPAPRYLDEFVLMKLWRWVTFNGHLIPDLFLKKQTTLEKLDGPFLRKVFGYKKIYVFHFEDGTGYQLTHNKKYFFRNNFTFGSLLIRLMFSKKSLLKKKPQLLDYMTEEFWKQQFSEKGPQNSNDQSEH